MRFLRSYVCNKLRRMSRRVSFDSRRRHHTCRILNSLYALILCCTEIVRAHGLSPLLAEVQIRIHVGEKMPLPTLGERHD